MIIVKLSKRGAIFIEHWEGFRAYPYNDAANNATIGIGHLLHYGPVTKEDEKKFPHGLTNAQALLLLQKDAAIAARAVKEYIHIRLTQAQKDALISFVYNCGTHSLDRTNVQNCVNARNFSAVPSALDQWVHAGGKVLQGLVNRRAAEGRLFLHGTYSLA